MHPDHIVRDNVLEATAVELRRPDEDRLDTTDAREKRAGDNLIGSSIAPHRVYGDAGSSGQSR